MTSVHVELATNSIKLCIIVPQHSNSKIQHKTQWLDNKAAGGTTWRPSNVSPLTAGCPSSLSVGMGRQGPDSGVACVCAGCYQVPAAAWQGKHAVRRG